MLVRQELVSFKSKEIYW